MRADRSQKRNAVLGALMLLGLIGSALLIFFMPDLTRLAKPSIQIVALMPAAGTLDAKSSVWIAGRQAGSVMGVQIRPVSVDSTERVAVTLRIPVKYAEQVRRDSEVRITTEHLIGNAVVDIQPGSRQSPAVQDGDSLRTRPTGTLEGLMDRTEKLTADFDNLLREAMTQQKPAQQRGRELAKLEGNLRSLNVSFHQVTSGLANGSLAGFTSAEFRGTVDRLRATMGHFNEVLQSAAQRNRAFRRESQPVFDELRARADTISAIMDQVQKSIAEHGGGLLVRAQRDSAIIKGLHRAQVEMDSLMAVTKRNPLRFWF